MLNPVYCLAQVLPLLTVHRKKLVGLIETWSKFFFVGRKEIKILCKKRKRRATNIFDVRTVREKWEVG